MSFFQENIVSENQQIHSELLNKKKIELFIKREDKIHPFVSGNKFRKLKYNIQEAKKQGVNTLLTFGGAYSNHIVATAVAGNLSECKTIGIIRGEELANQFHKTLSDNYTLRNAHKNGMSFKFISREKYRNKTSEEFIKRLRDLFGEFYLIPEGGTNCLAIKGCEEILNEEDKKFDYICTPVGTGGTISGLINSCNLNQKILGFPALKGDFMYSEIEKYVHDKTNWGLCLDYHFGGYAKYNTELIKFINQFYSEHKIPLDPIYTGKMVYGVFDLINNNKFKKGAKILVIHTGGLQGIKSFNNKLTKKNEKTIQCEY